MPHPALAPHRFRTLPVEIEAIQFDGSGTSQVAIKRWAGDAVTSTFDDVQGWGVTVGNRHLEIATLEGVMKASPGDWIIKGLRGEFYPCKPDVFNKKYELVGPAVGATIIDED